MPLFLLCAYFLAKTARLVGLFSIFACFSSIISLDYQLPVNFRDLFVLFVRFWALDSKKNQVTLLLNFVQNVALDLIFKLSLIWDYLLQLDKLFLDTKWLHLQQVVLLKFCNTKPLNVFVRQNWSSLLSFFPTIIFVLSYILLVFIFIQFRYILLFFRNRSTCCAMDC